MTKKDYEKVAEVFRQAEPAKETPARFMWEKLVVMFCEMLRADNPRFDRARFLAACKNPE